MQEIIKALSWTFLHSLWQGLLAALLAAIIISVTKKATAKLRYNLLGLVLLFFLAVSCITFQVTLQQQLNELALFPSFNAGTGDNTILSAAALSATIPVQQDIIATLRNWFNNNADLLMLAWTLIFLLNCLKLVTGLATVRRLRYYKTSPVSAEWKTKLDVLKTALTISQPVQLLQSAIVKIPVVLGILKPVILLPVGLLANIPPEQAEAILLHELAHVRRKDYLLNLIQRFADAVFFFNPAFLWLSSLLRQEREACCDDLAVANTGLKRNYVDALVSFEEYSLNHSSPVMAIGSKRHYLLDRVKRIMTNENKRLNLLEKSGLLAGIFIFSAFTMMQSNNYVKEEPVSLKSRSGYIMTNSFSQQLQVVERNIPEQNIPMKETRKIKELTPASPDTIPPVKEKKVYTETRDRKLKAISSTTEIFNNVKIKIIKGNGEDGTLYHVRTENGKSTKFTVNGEVIPDSELGKWSDVLNQLYYAADNKDKVEQNRAYVESNKQYTESNMKAVLKDIERIKEKMAQKKEQIGLEKKKIQAFENKKEAQDAEDRLKKKRDELERDRDELKKKRDEIENYKEKLQEEKRETKKRAPKKVVRPTRKAQLFTDMKKDVSPAIAKPSTRFSHTKQDPRENDVRVEHTFFVKQDLFKKDARMNVKFKLTTLSELNALPPTKPKIPKSLPPPDNKPPQISPKQVI